MRRSERSLTKKRKRSGGADLISALPDDLLNHVLSFLPSCEAIKSSLFSRRWRQLWRSTPAVIVGGEGDSFRLFVNTLLIRRDGASPPLRSFDIDADLMMPPKHPDDDPWTPFDGWRDQVDPHVDMWINYALSTGRARSLTACFQDELNVWRPRSALTFASPHLTRIHLDAVHLVDDLLDFSCCPALLRLTLVRCHLEGDDDALESPSVERLAIVGCHTEVGRDPRYPDDRMLVKISTPRLRFLEISRNYDQEQFLEMMPWLTKENVRYIDKTWIPCQWK